MEARSSVPGGSTEDRREADRILDQARDQVGTARRVMPTHPHTAVMLLTEVLRDTVELAIADIGKYVTRDAMLVAEAANMELRELVRDDDVEVRFR